MLCGGDESGTEISGYASLFGRVDQGGDLVARGAYGASLAAAEAAGKPVPPLQPVLATRASAHSWDVALAGALEHLIALDAGLRRRRLSLGL